MSLCCDLALAGRAWPQGLVTLPMTYLANQFQSPGSLGLCRLLHPPLKDFTHRNAGLFYPMSFPSVACLQFLFPFHCIYQFP